MVKGIDGGIHPASSSSTWTDGSLASDLPILRLKELFNVSELIVSQVNPYVIPFLEDTGIPENDSFFNYFKRTFKYLVRTEVVHRVNQFADLGVLSFISKPLQTVFNQQYVGDITIVPKLSFWDYFKIISNPTPSSFQYFEAKGRISAFSKLSHIFAHCKIEIKLDLCINDTIRKLQTQTPNANFAIKHSSSFKLPPPKSTKKSKKEGKEKKNKQVQPHSTSNPLHSTSNPLHSTSNPLHSTSNLLPHSNDDSVLFNSEPSQVPHLPFSSADSLSPTEALSPTMEPFFVKHKQKSTDKN